MTVVLTGRLYQQMLDHALRQPQLEVCGLLGGAGGCFNNYYPIENVADDPHRTFLMDPAGQVQAMRVMRDRGESLTGIYHTHPDTSAHPSSRDLEQARYANIYYLIMSLEHSTPKIGAFYFDGDRFQDTPITIAPPSETGI